MNMNSEQSQYTAAFAHYQRGDFARCNAELETLLNSNPNFAPALLLKGVSQAPEARLLGGALCSAATRAQSLDGESWFNMGVFHKELGRADAALQDYRRALVLSPLHTGTLGNGAELLRLHEYFEESLVAAERHQKIEPHVVNGYANAGVCHAFLGNLEEADAAYKKGIAIATDPASMYWEWHFSKLAREWFKEAWEGYEYRFACGHLNGVSDIAFPYPKWKGEPLKDKHILLYGEQGIGDQIMFASAFRDLLALGCRVSFAVYAGLADLMGASFPQIEIIPIPDGPEGLAVIERLRDTQGAGKDIDYVLPVGSLMTHFRNRREDFPGVAFLKPTEAARASWQDIVSPDADKLKIGLCWATNPAPHRFESKRRAGHKTMPLFRLDPLGEVPGIAAYSLWNHPLALAGEAPWIRDVSEKLTTLDQTAALIEQLDLVITVDTGVAHLAGALGKETWLMLHHHGDARWGLHGTEHSYWYPHITSFWQEQARGWDEVIGRVKARLIRDYDRLMAQRALR